MAGVVLDGLHSWAVLTSPLPVYLHFCRETRAETDRNSRIFCGTDRMAQLSREDSDRIKAIANDPGVKEAFLAEVQGAVVREMRTIASDTPVRIRTTPTQMWTVGGAFVSMVVILITLVWMLAKKDSEIRQEIKTIRQDMMTQSGHIEATIEKMDITWQLRLSETLKNMPTEFPPRDWLQDVYRRDQDLLERRLDRIEAQLNMS